MLPKEEVLRIIAHCKDTGQSYKERCAELGVKIWQFHEAKVYYKRLEADGKTVSVLQAKGWRVITLWECDLKPTRREATLNQLLGMLRSVKQYEIYDPSVAIAAESESMYNKKHDD